MDSVKETLDDILKPRSGWVSKSMGIAIATVTYIFAGMSMVPIPCCRRNANVRRQGVGMINSVVLSVAYVYSWKESNPHEAEALENSPSNEIPLMLTAGHYILDSLSHRSFLDVLHHMLSISAIMALLLEGRAANIGVTFAFLVEVVNLLYNIRKFAIHIRSPCVLFLNILYPLAFMLIRIIALMHLSYKIVNNNDLPEVPQSLAGILFMMSFFYFFRMFQQTFGRRGEPGLSRRSRSRTPRMSITSKLRPSGRIGLCGLTQNIFSCFK